MADETETQATEQSQPPPTPPQSQPSIDLSGVMTALNALPEQISRAVKEAVTPPKQAPVQKQQSTEDKSTADSPKETAKKEPEHQSPGKKKSLADWWFN